jgi:hypothetical protein
MIAILFVLLLTHVHGYEYSNCVCEHKYIYEDESYGLLSMKFLTYPTGIIAFLIQDKITKQCKGYYVTYLENYKNSLFLKEVVSRDPMSQEDLEEIFPEFI